jgi:hypothetical protein
MSSIMTEYQSKALSERCASLALWDGRGRISTPHSWVVLARRAGQWQVQAAGRLSNCTLHRSGSSGPQTVRHEELFLSFTKQVQIHDVGES